MRPMVGVWVLALVVAFMAVPAWAGAPTDVVKQYTEQVIKVLEDPALKGEDKRLERRKAVRKVATEVFDVGETARRALGRHWQARTPAEREEFVQLFADLLERSYVSRIDEYGGERVKYESEKVEGDNAVVRTKIVTKTGQEVPVDARMIRRGDRWMIYDISIEGISLVGNYRGQFDRVISKSSYAELVRLLKEKQDLPAGSSGTPEARPRRSGSPS
jgi:phospholipid transport system substrate-binding protein